MIEFLAQLPPNPEWWTPMLNGGSAAAVLGPIVIWFAMRLEKILEKLREAVDRNSHALMVGVLNTRHLDDGLRSVAEQLKHDSEEALKK